MEIMTEKEKRLFILFNELESEKCKDDLIFQAEAMARAQEALKADYGLVNSRPLYTDRRTAPVGAA